MGAKCATSTPDYVRKIDDEYLASKQEGDYMAMLVDAGSKQLKIIEVKTSLDGDAVDVQIISKNLDDGLSYTARQVVKVPARKVELIIENYDFRRQ